MEIRGAIKLSKSKTSSSERGENLAADQALVRRN